MGEQSDSDGQLDAGTIRRHRDHRSPARECRITVRLAEGERDLIAGAAVRCGLTSTGFTAKAAIAAATAEVTPMATPIEGLRELLRELFATRRSLYVEMERLMEAASHISEANASDPVSGHEPNTDGTAASWPLHDNSPAVAVAVWRAAIDRLDAVIARISRRL